jgi:DNA-directed RNA polymerase subunit beta'
VLFATSYGRILFNETLPTDYPFVNEQVAKGKLSRGSSMTSRRAIRRPRWPRPSTRSRIWDSPAPRGRGVTMSFSDIVEPPEGNAIIKDYENQADKVNSQYDMGLLTEEERRQELINLWTECTDKVANAMRDNFHDDNNVNIMVQSGARGNWMQIRQIAGMRGLVANPKGEIIPRPVKSNYREGLSVLEYFISQHGARKGLADTALRYRRIGLPDPSTRGRGPGGHRARGGLRHQARAGDEGRRTRRGRQSRARQGG